MQEDDTTFDDLMSSLGIEDADAPLTSEEALYTILFSGNRFSNTLCLIDFDANKWFAFKDRGWMIVCDGLAEDGKTKKPITMTEYIRLLLEYYLCMYHLTRFNTPFTFEGREYPPCDLEKTLDLFMQHERIQKICKKKDDNTVDYEGN